MNIVSNIPNKKAVSQLPQWPVISTVILILYFSILYFPPLEVAIPANNVTLGCFILWCALSFINDPGYYFNMKPYVMLALVFYAFSVVVPIVCGYTVIANRYAALPLVSFGYMIYDYYKVHNHTKYLKNAFVIPAVLALTTSIITYAALMENSYIVRSATSLGENAEEYYASGICGYGFVYAVVTASPLFLYIFLKTKNKLFKALSMAAFVFSIMFTVKANFLTAFLVAIISSVILISGYLFKKSKKNFIYIFILILVVVLFITNYSAILNAIESHIPRRIATVLFNTSEDSLIESIYAEFSSDRINTITQSFEAILENPLFGILGSRGIDTSGDYLTGFGQHSHILDTFALYGVLIGVLCVAVIIQPILSSKNKKNSDIYFTVAVAANALSIFLLNNATESIAVSYCILFPLIRDHFAQKQIVEPQQIVVQTEEISEEDLQQEESSDDVSIEFDPSAILGELSDTLRNDHSEKDGSINESN